MKYYSIKNEGKWFARVPKEDQDPAIPDGRVVRNWEYKQTQGSTLGWFKDELKGRITGAEVRSLGEDNFFSIYLDSGDVAQFKLYESNFLSLAQSLGNIDLHSEVVFQAGLNSKKAWTNKKSGKVVVPTSLYVKQNDQNVAQTWPYDADERWFTGLPKPTVVEKFGRTTRDSSLMEAAFDNEIDSFITRVEEFGGEEPTSSAAVTESDENDLAF